MKKAHLHTRARSQRQKFSTMQLVKNSFFRLEPRDSRGSAVRAGLCARVYLHRSFFLALLSIYAAIRGHHAPVYFMSRTKNRLVFRLELAYSSIRCLYPHALFLYVVKFYTYKLVHRRSTRAPRKREGLPCQGKYAHAQLLYWALRRQKTMIAKFLVLSAMCWAATWAAQELKVEKVYVPEVCDVKSKKGDPADDALHRHARQRQQVRFEPRDLDLHPNRSSMFSRTRSWYLLNNYISVLRRPQVVIAIEVYVPGDGGDGPSRIASHSFIYSRTSIKCIHRTTLSTYVNARRYKVCLYIRASSVCMCVYGERRRRSQASKSATRVQVYVPPNCCSRPQRRSAVISPHIHIHGIYMEYR
ncbi:unnamed protein product [Trichogramma brassicae]|uniref:Uncharacterized protein n=1 Tax=Trichogramma brassicae TaxID=86971 RepID=A0A6H5HTL8_9HYME|nr:unnamed protein product [Trichogramma brassicae]